MLRYENANDSDAEILTEMAFTSKQHWGYSDAQMESWRSDLTVTKDYIAKNEVVKIYHANELIGFYSILDGEPAEVDHLWLLPNFIRRGFGVVIFNAIRESVANRGQLVFHLVAEPHAKGFYDRMGGIVIRSFESKIPGRFLEVYEFATHPE